MGIECPFGTENGVLKHAAVGGRSWILRFNFVHHSNEGHGVLLLSGFQLLEFAGKVCVDRDHFAQLYKRARMKGRYHSRYMERSVSAPAVDWQPLKEALGRFALEITDYLAQAPVKSILQ